MLIHVDHKESVTSDRQKTLLKQLTRDALHRSTQMCHYSSNRCEREPHSRGILEEAHAFLVQSFFRGIFFLLMYVIQHCFIFRPSDSTVSEDAGIEPRTVATLVWTARRSNHLARSHPHLARSHPHLARSYPHLARSRPRLGQISSTNLFWLFDISPQNRKKYKHHVNNARPFWYVHMYIRVHVETVCHKNVVKNNHSLYIIHCSAGLQIVHFRAASAPGAGTLQVCTVKKLFQKLRY